MALPEDRVHTIPNWIDPARFQSIDRDAARAIFRLRSNLVVACIGEITPAKGQEEFIRAAARVSRMRQDVEFIIVGEERDEGEPFTRELKRLAETFGLSERLTFMGYVRHIPELLAATDIVVVPSWDEGFSLVTIEAMAARRPVLASNVGGISGIIKENVTGALFPAKNVNALGDKLTWLISDGALRDRLAAQGQRDVYTRFGREQIIEQIESLYVQILTGNKKKT